MPRSRKKNSAFTRILNDLLAEKGLKIREAAEIAGIPQSTLGDWLAGTSPSDFEAIRRLAEHFNVSVSYMLTGLEDRSRRGVSPPISAILGGGGILFQGMVEVTIRRLVPKSEIKNEDHSDH